MVKSWALWIGLCVAALLIFYPRESKTKQSFHDDSSYKQFCRDVLEKPELYRTFRSHPLYRIFQEDLNEKNAEESFAYLESHYGKLLQERELIESLDAIGQPLQCRGIGYPTLRNLKIAGDIERYFGHFNDKTIVQIGASDGSLCKILMELHHPIRYCIIDIEPCLALARKTLADWGVQGVEFYTPEEFKPPQVIDLVVSPFVFAESPRYKQMGYLKILRRANCGYLDCRFPMRHFGLKVWTDEQILEKLRSIGKSPQVIQEQPLTDIDRCSILFCP